MSLDSVDENASGPSNTDDVLSVLAVETRRYALRYFLESAEHTATLDDVAGYVAGRLGNLSEESRQRTRINLHHVHLPKLASAGLVDYESRTSTVRYRGHPFAEKIVEWCE